MAKISGIALLTYIILATCSIAEDTGSTGSSEGGASATSVGCGHNIGGNYWNLKPLARTK